MVFIILKILDTSFIHYFIVIKRIDGIINMPIDVVRNKNKFLIF